VSEPSVVAAWAQHQFAAKAFCEVTSAFESAGVPCLAVKGIVLSRLLYEAVEQRPMVDVDLRVRPRDLERARRAARDRGWSVKSTSRQLGTFEMHVEHTLVEIESTIGPPGVCAIGVGEMLERAATVTSPELGSHLEPELHDHALLLCVNAFKDKLVLAQTHAREDLLRLGALPKFDPAVLVHRAHHARLTTLVGIVARWLGTDPRAEAWRRAADALPRRRRWYRAAYARAVRSSPEGVVASGLARAASDSPLLRGKAVFLGLVGTLARVLDGGGSA